MKKIVLQVSTRPLPASRTISFRCYSQSSTKSTCLNRFYCQPTVTKLHFFAKALLKAMFYLQMPINRSGGTRTRTGDTMIFSPNSYVLACPRADGN